MLSWGHLAAALQLAARLAPRQGSWWWRLRGLKERDAALRLGAQDGAHVREACWPPRASEHHSVRPVYAVAPHEAVQPPIQALVQEVCVRVGRVDGRDPELYRGLSSGDLGDAHALAEAHRRG